MFGSTNPFGQSSSSSPFGSSVFGQASSATNNNPFAPSPFGSSFGSAVFGGTSTGVFGQQPSTPVFGASSSPSFGSSTPAFGSSSSAFGGSSIFGQKPALGGFGSSSSQSGPFGSTFQQSQPGFGSSLFGSSTPFGQSSQPAFGATSTPAFGSTSTPAFGATGTPAFGATSTPAFGATSTPAFGATTNPAFGTSTSSLFGTTGTGFSASSTPAFGSTTTTAFGSAATPIFGSSSTPAFDTAFGASSTPTFGASSTPSFGFGSSPASGQSTPAFGSSPFGTTLSPFGTQSSPFGTQSATPAFGSPSFGQPAFGSQQGGTRIAPYSPTIETDVATGAQPGKLESISAMPVYKDKSHEELRWEDYQRGDKGGPNPAGQPTGVSAPSQASSFSSTSPFGQTASNTLSSMSSSLFGSNPAFGSTGFGSSSSIFGSSAFGSSSSSPFPSISNTPSLFGATSAHVFGSNTTPSLFTGTTTSAFSSSASPFGSSTLGTSPAFGSTFNTQSSGLFQSTTPSFSQTSSPFAQPSGGLQQTSPAFGSSVFGTLPTGFGGSVFSSSTPSLVPTSSPLGFGQTTLSLSTQFPAPTQPNTFSLPNFGQSQPATSTGFGNSLFNPTNFGQPTASQSNVVVQPTPTANPFGTLPAIPQMSIGGTGSSPLVQYGISSMPVADKPVPVRTSSLMAPRHVSRKIRLPARNYHPKTDGPKVPFFMDDEELPSTPKADALFIPRENPRALIIRPVEQWPSRSSEKQSISKEPSVSAAENGRATGSQATTAVNGTFAEVFPAENGHMTGQGIAASSSYRSTLKPNGIVHDDQPSKEADSAHRFISGHRAGEAAIVYEHGADIEAHMPKLRHDDYYTEPRIQELAAKERAEPGFCRRVKNFVVGRRGYGSIKFDGETDVRRLDLESIIQFNNREVIVYKDESKKPPVGQGLNKPAEVTLLNIKCVNKKTGQQYTGGPKVDKYKEMLMKKAEEQGAEFVSYDPVKGEWKFRVKHFSSYELGDCDLQV